MKSSILWKRIIIFSSSLPEEIRRKRFDFFRGMELKVRGGCRPEGETIWVQRVKFR